MTYAPTMPGTSGKLTFSELWLSFTGRATRSDYWLRFVVPYVVGMFIVMMVDRMVPIYVMTVMTDAGVQSVQFPVLLSL